MPFAELEVRRCSRFSGRKSKMPSSAFLSQRTRNTLKGFAILIFYI